MRDMNAGVPCTVAVIVHCAKCKSVQEGPIRGGVGEGGAGRGLESPKTPLSVVVVGDASYCRGGSAVQLILHHGGSVGMAHIDFAGAG